MTLHDYVSKNHKWQQLWADDKLAVWFEETDSKQYPYEVFYAKNSALFDNGVMVISQSFCKELSEAFDIWNGVINKHLNKGAKSEKI